MMTSFLSPLDMLFMPEDEQKILSFLTRKPKSTLGKIAKFTGLAIDEVEKLVTRLVKDAVMVHEKNEGQDVYSVRYQHAPTRIRNTSSTFDRL